MNTRKLVSFLLVVVLLFSNALPVYAIDTREQYGNLPVEYTNGKGTFALPVMVTEGNLYVDGIKLADCLGYKSVVSKNKGIVIYNDEMSKNLPFGYTQFLIDSREVISSIGRLQKISYEAPCPAVSNAKGYWIPLNYALTILRAGGIMIEGTLIVTLPQKSVLDLVAESPMYTQQYDFDWFDDFGYNDFSIIAKSLNSQFVNFSNGLLQCGGDSTSWKTLFQYLTFSEMDAYDKKYANELAVLFCTYAEEELKQIAKTVEDANNVFSSDGKFGSLVKKLSKVEDNTVGEAYKQLERAKTSLEQGNPCTLTYSKAYQYLEKTLDSQKTFEKTAGTFLEVQEKVKDATTVYTIGDSAVTIFDVLGGAADIVGYGSEFKNADEYSITALKSFINRNSEEDIESMMSEMDEYLNKIQGDVLTYGAYRYIYENWDNFIKKACKLSEGLGTQANIILAVWSIASSYVPFVKDGLDAADNFELASYSEILEKYSYVNYSEMWHQEMSDIDAINHEKIYKVGQAYYTYLKFCYITREAALSSLNMESRTKHFKEEVQPLINQQTDVNKEIAEVLAELKATGKDEKTYKLGFLPADSEIFNRDHSDEAWIAAINLNSVDGGVENSFAFLPNRFDVYCCTHDWRSGLDLNPDGTFTCEMMSVFPGGDDEGKIDGTGSVSTISGKFSNLTQVDDLTYKMTLDYAEQIDNVGTEYIEDRIQFTVTESNHFDGITEAYIYLPGTEYDIVDGCSIFHDGKELFYIGPYYQDLEKILAEGYVLYINNMPAFIGSTASSMHSEYEKESIPLGFYTSSDEKSALWIEENGNEITLSAWWLYKEDIFLYPEYFPGPPVIYKAVIEQDGSKATFDFFDSETGQSATGMVQFEDQKVVLVLDSSDCPHIPYEWTEYTWVRGKITNEEMKQNAQMLRVPDELDVEYKLYHPYYWPGADMYCTPFEVIYQGEVVAGADLGTQTGSVAGSIWTYSASHLE